MTLGKGLEILLHQREVHLGSCQTAKKLHHRPVKGY